MTTKYDFALLYRIQKRRTPFGIRVLLQRGDYSPNVYGKPLWRTEYEEEYQTREQAMLRVLANPVFWGTRDPWKN